MHTPRCSAVRLTLAVALPVAIAACAPAPIYKAGPAVEAATPQHVAAAPAKYAGEQVVWGGKVIGVSNLPDHTEVRILAYPLDGSQRPRVQQNADGRFVAVVPGFLDPMGYPKGTLVTVLGKLDGTWIGTVGQANYIYPKVNVQRANLHRWTAEQMHQGHPHISFGVGVGTWIH